MLAAKACSGLTGQEANDAGSRGWPLNKDAPARFKNDLRRNNEQRIMREVKYLCSRRNAPAR